MEVSFRGKIRSRSRFKFRLKVSFRATYLNSNPYTGLEQIFKSIKFRIIKSEKPDPDLESKSVLEPEPKSDLDLHSNSDP